MFTNRLVHIGREKAVELLVNNGANVNQESNKGWTPLHLASKMMASNGGVESIAAMLINKGADVNKADSEGKTPLHWAVKG